MVDFLLNPLIFFAVLLVVVMIHELGHFVTAKLAGIKILEMGFGIPPRLFAFKRGEIEYSINALPLGGFVKMLGEEDPTDPRSLAAQPPWVRIMVLSAGVTMNLILAIGLFTASFMIPRETVQGQVFVARVAPDSPAERAGLQPGDQIVRVNDRVIHNSGDLSLRVQRYLGDEVRFQVKGSGASFREITVVPRWLPPAGQGPTGIEIQLRNAYPTEVSYPIWEAVPMGIDRAWEILVLTKNSFYQTFARRVMPELTGPIGIYQMTSEVAKTGFGNLIDLAGLLSLNLAILNILPIPMVDGGRIVFVLIEIVRGGRRIAPEKESLVHFAGLVMLAVLFVVISYNDIMRFVSGGSLIR